MTKVEQVGYGIGAMSNSMTRQAIAAQGCRLSGKIGRRLEAGGLLKEERAEGMSLGRPKPNSAAVGDAHTAGQHGVSGGPTPECEPYRQCKQGGAGYE